MKKIFTFMSLLALVVALTLTGVFLKAGVTADDAFLHIHFHKWDENYENVGGHIWGDGARIVKGDDDLVTGVLPNGEKDAFGITFKLNVDMSKATADSQVGFIPVMAKSTNPDAGTIVQDWDNKLSSDADVMIPHSLLETGKDTHVYVYEGTFGNKSDADKGQVPYFVADPNNVNVLVTYFDQTGNYGENLGVHNWGFVENAEAWSQPLHIFKVVGVSAGINVLAGHMQVTPDPDNGCAGAGFLIYEGGEDNKRTGDVKQEVLPDVPFFAEKTPGAVHPIHVMSVPGGQTHNKNVYYGDKLPEFGAEMNAFRFVLGSINEGSGTFAMNKTSVYTKFNRALQNNYINLNDDEKKAYKETLLKEFKVEEVTVADNKVTVVKEVPIKEIYFNEFAAEAQEFILELQEELDNTKQYQVRYFQYIPEQPEYKQRTLKFTTTVPAGTENVYVVGSMNGWTPGDPTWKMTKGADGTTFTLEISTKMVPTNYEYKYVCAGAWDYAEVIAANRKLEMTDVDVFEITDTVSAWTNVPTDPVPEAAASEFKENDPTIIPLEAQLLLDLDKEAPEMIFISTFDVPEENVIYIKLNSKWDQALFPQISVNDDRDGDIFHRVYVPEDTEFKVLDTGKVGDYKILLKVSDAWGNESELTFIFRVVKKIPKK